MVWMILTSQWDRFPLRTSVIFCCEPIIEFLVPSFLLSFWRVQIAFIRDVLESVDQLTGFIQWGKDVDAVLPWKVLDTIQSWDVLIYIYIIPYLSISMDVHRTLIPWNLVHKQPPRESWGTLSPVRQSMHKWGYPKMVGLFHGKSRSKIDDLGVSRYPYFRKPRHERISCIIGRSPNVSHHFLGRAVDGSWDLDLEVS